MDRRQLLLGLALALAACSPAPAPLSGQTATAALLPLPAATATPVGAPAASPTPRQTPVIIASPTATATPVTHVVKAGETMLGIAIEYGISLDALQAANPTVEPRFLSVGTVLVIPPPEGGFAVAATNLAPPPPAMVQLSQPVCDALATGGLYCFVEAHNPNEQPIENVSARIILAGADGLPFASQTALAALDLVPAGGSLPMAALFEPSPTHTIAATGVELLTANVVSQAGSSSGAQMLTVNATPGSVVNGQWTVQGQVTNPAPQTLSSAWVLLTLYDAAGRVIGFRKLAIQNGLASGETKQFTIGADSLAGPVDHDRLLAEGQP